jgi:cobaltochelatase CobN
VASRYFDLLHEANVADEVVRDFIVRENPAAAAAIAARLDTARRRGLWHPRRNDIDAGLAGLMSSGAP